MAAKRSSDPQVVVTDEVKFNKLEETMNKRLKRGYEVYKLYRKSIDGVMMYTIIWRTRDYKDPNQLSIV